MADTNNKQVVADIDRSLYDFKDVESEKDFYRMAEGLTEETVLKVSEEKNDPEWMRDFTTILRYLTGAQVLKASTWTRFLPM